MESLKQIDISKVVFTYVVGIIAIGNFIFGNEFTLMNIIDGLKSFKIEIISQAFILLSFSIVLSVTILNLLKVAFGIKKPSRDGIDRVAAVLLPEDQLTNSESTNKKRLFRYNLINLTFTITLISIFLIILYKYTNLA